MSVPLIVILFVCYSVPSTEARRCKPTPPWLADWPEVCLLTDSIQRPYIDEQIEKEKELRVLEEKTVVNASTKCLFLLSRLFTEKRVWRGYITYVYLPECIELPKAQLWQIIEDLRDDGWATELHEIDVKMSPVYHPLGYFSNFLGIRVFIVEETAICSLDYHKDEQNVRSYCFLYYDTAAKKYRDGLIASKIDPSPPLSYLSSTSVCPERLQLIGFDLRDLLFNYF